MTDSQATVSPTVHTIRFDIDPGEGVAVVIDDQLNLATSQRRDYIGFPPRELFGADLPLLPTYPPRRVAVGYCSCGVVGCGVIAPRIAYAGVDEELVVWSDFRDLTGVYEDAIADPGQSTDGGTRIEQDDLVFDRRQYETAVLTAGADRSWETSSQATARLLRGMLRTDAARLKAATFELGWVAPARETAQAWSIELTVPTPHRTSTQQQADSRLDRDEARAADMIPEPGTLPASGTFSFIWASTTPLRPWEAEPRQVIIQLETAPAVPVVQAADLYRQLWDIPITDWETTFPWKDLARMEHRQAQLQLQDEARRDADQEPDQDTELERPGSSE